MQSKPDDKVREDKEIIFNLKNSNVCAFDEDEWTLEREKTDK